MHQKDHYSTAQQCRRGQTPPFINWALGQINNRKQHKLNNNSLGLTCSMWKHQVSDLIVTSPLIRFNHLLLYEQTLEGKPYTSGCGGQLGRRRMGWGWREKKRCTPHLFSSKTSTLLIKPGLCRERPEHTIPPYLEHVQATQTAYQQLYRAE